MLNISVDLGSFSVKFLSYKVEKKAVRYLLSHEVIIDQDEYNIFDENALTDLQLQILAKFLNEQTEEYQLFLSCPSEYLTSRLLELPINNKKKAKLMLPFQLETDLPFTLGEAHYASSLKVGKENSTALVSISKSEDFQHFFDKLKDYSITPKLLTSEVSSVSTYVKNTKTIFPTSFCILDIGHSHSKSYFFINNELVSTHISYIAGSSIDEMISQNYNISSEEASIYKHQNSFLLNESQYNQVTESQRAFAKLMNETFQKLVNDFKRWQVGFRVKYAQGVSQVYITGGSSNIKNICPYLKEKLNVSVSILDAFEEVNAKDIDKDSRFRNKFTPLNIFAQSTLKKSSLINLLNGKFSIENQSKLPIHSLYYLGSRVAVISALIIIGLFAERFFISRDISIANKKISKILKNPAIKLTPRLRRKAKSSPKQVLSKLKGQVKTIKQEVKVIQSSVNSNALISLERIRSLIQGIKIPIVKFQSLSQGDFIAVFQVKTQKEIDMLNKIFRAQSNKDLFVEENLEQSSYQVSGSDTK